MPKSYEYKFLNNPSISHLNELGTNGWEIINSVLHENRAPRGYQVTEYAVYAVLLKRVIKQ